MTASNLFTYDRSGDVLAIGDGDEILAHSGADESPLWRATARATLVALGATSDTVFAVDADGRLSRWSARDGQPGATLELKGTPKGLAVAENGTCAAVLEAAVVLVKSGVVADTLAVPGALSAAFSDDGKKLAVGASDKIVRVFSLGEDAAAEEGTKPLGQVDVGEPVRSLAWNAGGFWLATGGDRVLRVEADGSASSQVTRASGMTPDCLACSPDGSLIVLRLDPSTVVALAYPSRDTGATIQYIDKHAVGVAFGPPPFLGIGVTGGDGNKINLKTEAVHRTDTHPGRTHNRWMLSVAIDAKSLPKAYAGASAARKESAPAEAGEKKQGGMMPVAIGALVVILGIILLVARCQ
jgi:hypothetical protein